MLHTWLPSNILTKADMMAMAHSLEVRVPFLDPKVYAVAASLPLRHRVAGRQTKVALRAAAARLLPAETARRPKLGFPVPFRAWLEGGLGAWLLDLAAECDGSLLDRREVGQLVTDRFQPEPAPAAVGSADLPAVAPIIPGIRPANGPAQSMTSKAAPTTQEEPHIRGGFA